MKDHVIIPVFLPHEGCPNDCVFCNQKRITAKVKPLEKEAVCRMVQEYMKTISKLNVKTVQMAFYGGSFTGMPVEKQRQYLKIALDYKNQGVIDKIRLSTRPDYIDETILDNLKSYGVDIIELGAQSFDEDVLRLSKRGHDSEAIYRSADLIREYGFTLGIQLMIGLPGDSPNKAEDSAKMALEAKPDIARIYPTVVIKDTELCRMYQDGYYQIWPLEKMVDSAKTMCRILRSGGVNVIRIGLKSTDNIAKGGDIFGDNYHPAFRQLVEGEIARESIIEQVDKLAKMDMLPEMTDNENCLFNLQVSCSEKSFSNMIGHKASNKKYFSKHYPNGRFKYEIRKNMADNVYDVEIMGKTEEKGPAVKRQEAAE